MTRSTSIALLLLLLPLATGMTKAEPIQSTQNVTIRVIDQFGQAIPASQFRVGGTTYDSGSSASVELGSVEVTLFPGVMGQRQGQLGRVVTAEVTGSTSSLDLLWRTSQLTVDVEDQFGSPISRSHFLLPGVYNTTILTPATITLPITDESVHSGMFGALSGGFPVGIEPGVLGNQQFRLRRTAVQEIGVNAETLVMEWFMSDVTVDVVDQFNNPIPRSHFNLPALANATILTPGVVSLPITDESEYPSMTGELSSGYTFGVEPGILGGQQFRLRRTVDREVTTSPLTIVVEWETAEVDIEIVDQHGASIPRSGFNLPGLNNNKVLTPATITLPVNDHSVYPEMSGELAAGYPFAFEPGVFGQQQRALKRSSNHKITSGSNTISVEWITSDVLVNIVDQHQVPIPGSRFILSEVIYKYIRAAKTYSLPITDESVYPDMSGGPTNGYQIVLVPGIFGEDQHRLIRIQRREVLETTTELNFEWITGHVDHQLIDQNGDPIAGSRILTYGVGSIWIPGTSSFDLPVTDESIYPDIQGDFTDGYWIDLFPGFFAGSQTGLHRRENLEVYPGSTSEARVWRQAECEPWLEDSNGGIFRANNFKFNWNFAQQPSAIPFTIPVTQDSKYGPFLGTLTSGYPVRVQAHSGGPWATATIEFSESGLVSTATFELDGVDYSLSCTHPIPDADGDSIPDDEDADSFGIVGVPDEVEHIISDIESLASAHGGQILTNILKHKRFKRMAEPANWAHASSLELTNKRHKSWYSDNLVIAGILINAGRQDKSISGDVKALALRLLSISRTVSMLAVDDARAMCGTNSACVARIKNAEYQISMARKFEGLAETKHIANVTTAIGFWGRAHAQAVIAYSYVAEKMAIEKVIIPAIPSASSSTELFANYPNPFNPQTTISYSLSNSETVRIEVFDLLGRSVATLVNQPMEAGEHTVRFDAGQLPSGMYIYRMTAGGQSFTKTMRLIK